MPAWSAKNTRFQHARELVDPSHNINYNNIVENNKEILCRESDVFGLCWLSDGATIARMPLLNILGLCTDSPPTCKTGSLERNTMSVCRQSKTDEDTIFGDILNHRPMESSFPWLSNGVGVMYTCWVVPSMLASQEKKRNHSL